MFKRKTGEQAPKETLADSPFWKFFSKLGDFFVLSTFWLLTSLPIVTIGTSTAALFYVVLKARNGQAGTLWKMYKKSFLQNLKQSIGIWLLYLFVLIDVFIIGSIYVKSGAIAWQDFFVGGKYHIALIIVACLYVAMMIYTAALLAFFKQTTRQCIVAAFCLTFNRIFSTLYVMIVIATLSYLTFYIFPALIFVDVPLAVYLISIRMDKIFHKQIARVEKREGIAHEDPAQDE